MTFLLVRLDRIEIFQRSGGENNTNHRVRAVSDARRFCPDMIVDNETANLQRGLNSVATP